MNLYEALAIVFAVLAGVLAVVGVGTTVSILLLAIAVLSLAVPASRRI